jgi:acyl carrier protein
MGGSVPTITKLRLEWWIRQVGLPKTCPRQYSLPIFWKARPGENQVPSVEERVIEIVCENLGVNKDQVKRETRFIEDIGADSLDIVELIMELEEEFEINIPDDQAEKIKTVGEAINYIEAEIKKK